MLRASRIFFSGWPSAVAMWPTMAGSTEPLRVPIITPSSGVRPMVVSTLLPFRTAVHEQPLPRWAVTRAWSAAGSPASPSAWRATKRWLVPWKP